MILPFYVGETLLSRPVPFGVQTLWTIAYVAIFPSVLAMLCFNRGVAIIGPNRAGPFQHLIPVSAAVFAVAFLGERLVPYHLIGFAAIAAGLYFATTRPDQR